MTTKEKLAAKVEWFRDNFRSEINNPFPIRHDAVEEPNKWWNGDSFYRRKNIMSIATTEELRATLARLRGRFGREPRGEAIHGEYR